MKRIGVVRGRHVLQKNSAEELRELPCENYKIELVVRYEFCKGFSTAFKKCSHKSRTDPQPPKTIFFQFNCEN